jgi:DNA primase
VRAALPGLRAASVYQDYRRRLNARSVLDYYGVQNDREEVTSSGETEVVHSCLLDRIDRHHNNGDQNPSASCNLDRKLYVCYAYWGGDLLHLIQKMENRDSFEEILPLVSKFLDGAVVQDDDLRAEVDRLEQMINDRGGYSVELPSYSSRVLTPWSFIHPYLHERGIDSDTASRMQIGWREDDNRIIIPHFWDGKLVGWQARAIPDRPGQWPGTATPNPKYRNTSGFPKADTFFYDHSRPFPTGGTVLLVESPFSVIKAASLGVQIPVLASFGAKVSAIQTRMLFEYDRVVLWADPDPAGQLMERTLLNRLSDHPGLSVVTPDEGRDLADCDSLIQVLDKIDAAIPAVLK